MVHVSSIICVNLLQIPNNTSCLSVVQIKIRSQSWAKVIKWYKLSEWNVTTPFLPAISINPSKTTKYMVSTEIKRIRVNLYTMHDNQKTNTVDFKSVTQCT